MNKVRLRCDQCSNEHATDHHGYTITTVAAETVLTYCCDGCGLQARPIDARTTRLLAEAGVQVVDLAPP